MPRAINVTNSEISSIFYIIGMIIFMVCFWIIFDMWRQVALVEFVFLMFLLATSCVFFTIAWFWMNYIITKYNLNLFVDRISNPNYIGWLRFTRSKSFRPQIVSVGPLGQTKGMASGSKADIINDGEYTVTLQNGNKAIIKNDQLSSNINLEQAVRWQMIKKHFNVWGFKAWEKCVDDEKTLFRIEDKDGKEPGTEKET